MICVFFYLNEDVQICEDHDFLIFKVWEWDLEWCHNSQRQVMHCSNTSCFELKGKEIDPWLSKLHMSPSGCHSLLKKWFNNSWKYYKDDKNTDRIALIQWWGWEHILNFTNLILLLLHGTELSEKSMSIPWLLMAWLLAQPGHHKPCHWLYEINGPLSSVIKVFQLSGPVTVPIHDKKCKYILISIHKDSAHIDLTQQLIFSYWFELWPLLVRSNYNLNQKTVISHWNYWRKL